MDKSLHGDRPNVNFVQCSRTLRAVCAVECAYKVCLITRLIELPLIESNKYAHTMCVVMYTQVGPDLLL